MVKKNLLHLLYGLNFLFGHLLLENNFSDPIKVVNPYEKIFKKKFVEISRTIGQKVFKSVKIENLTPLVGGCKLFNLQKIFSFESKSGIYEILAQKSENLDLPRSRDIKAQMG